MCEYLYLSGGESDVHTLREWYKRNLQEEKKKKRKVKILIVKIKANVHDKVMVNHNNQQ